MLRAPESKHVTSTTVPESTGNCVVVLMVFSHAVLRPVQPDSIVIVIKKFSASEIGIMKFYFADQVRFFIQYLS